MQYGSDALGGSLNVLTRSPRLSPDAVRASGVVDLAVRGADRGSVAGAVIDVAGPHAALSAGATARGSRELRTGRGTDSRAAVTRFVGLPSTVLYTRLPRTDYGQTSGRLAGVVGVGDGEVTGSYLHTGQHGVNRFHRELGGDGLHRSEFEPQRLDVGNLRYRADRAGPLTSLIGAFSFNRQQDDRLEQARPSTRVEREALTTLALGYQVQASLPVSGGHALTFGGEVYDEYIAADGSFEDPATRRSDGGPPPYSRRHPLHEHRALRAGDH